MRQTHSRVEHYQEAASWRKGNDAVLEHLRCAPGASSALATSGQIVQSLPSLHSLTEQSTSPTAVAHLHCPAQPQAGCCLTWRPCAGPACDRAASRRAHFGFRSVISQVLVQVLSVRGSQECHTNTSGMHVCLAKLSKGGAGRCKLRRSDHVLSASSRTVTPSPWQTAATGKGSWGPPQPSWQM